MNKIIKTMTLILITAGTLAIGMEEYRGNVYLTNRLVMNNAYGVLPLKCKVTNKGNTKEVIIDKAEETKLLDDITSIIKIEIGTYVPLASETLLGKYSPTSLVVNKIQDIGFMTDITKDFLTKLKTEYRTGDVMKIIVDWKYPDSYTSREWKYTFITGTFNPFIISYPWKWVINNTTVDIEIKEVIDSKSLYAQEMADQGLSVGNPVKLAPGKRLELFEDNKRFSVHAKISGWFEPNYANLEQQVAAGKDKDENKGKIPVVVISSKQCLGISTGCGWDFQIKWIGR